MELHRKSSLCSGINMYLTRPYTAYNTTMRNQINGQPESTTLPQLTQRQKMQLEKGDLPEQLQIQGNPEKLQPPAEMPMCGDGRESGIQGCIMLTCLAWSWISSQQ